MRTRIGNNIKIYEPSADVIKYCNDNLTITNPNYIKAERLGLNMKYMKPTFNIYHKSYDSYILPFGCIAYIYKYISQGTIETNFCDLKPNLMQGNIKLYDYQERALNSLLRCKNGVLKAPCGSGKTNIGLQLIKELGLKALWLTHTRDLLTQSKERCEAYFKGDFGTITDGKIDIGRDITFATVQTLSKVDPQYYRDEFNVVVVDECHKVVNDPKKVMMFYKVIDNLNCRYKFGLSATTKREDGLEKCMFACLGRQVHEIQESEIGDKIIHALHIREDVNLDYDLLDYVKEDGTIDYNALIDILSNRRERNEQIVENVIKYASRRQLLLVHRVAHANLLNEMLREQGIDSIAITGKIKSSNRDFNHQVIIATYTLAKEGLDIPELEILHLATPQKNNIATKQSAGRVERNIAGKKQPLIIDYVDNNIPYCIGCFKKRKRILKNI